MPVLKKTTTRAKNQTGTYCPTHDACALSASFDLDLDLFFHDACVVVWLLFGSAQNPLPFGQFNNMDHLFKNDDSSDDEDDRRRSIRKVMIMTSMKMLHGNELFKGSSSAHKGRRPGSKTVRRIRRPLHVIFNECSDHQFRRSYRMNQASFWKLLDILEPVLARPPRKKGRAPNGDVPPSVRLAIALRFFAGGDPLDLCAVFSVNSEVVYQSIWRVVEAINHSKKLEICYPTHHDDQQKIADEFKAKSDVQFNNCAGCVDGILIWIHKPSIKELEMLGIGGKKFFCGRKKKFGLNMQATCDARRRFLDVEIRHPGSTSDYLAFAVSSLHHKMEGNNLHAIDQPFLKPGLALYGDNAYVNTSYFVVPFKAVSGGSKDAYNFYHSQLRINIECAFGMLVHRWGVLRKPIPMRVSLSRTNAMVMALCQLHNFCIDEKEALTKPLAEDVLDIASHGGIDLTAFENINQDDGDITYNHERDRIDFLIDGGNDRTDIPQSVRRQQHRYYQQINPENPLPFQVMHQYIEEQGFQRPMGGGCAC